MQSQITRSYRRRHTYSGAALETLAPLPYEREFPGDDSSAAQVDTLKLTPSLPALALIHSGVLVLMVWLASFFPIHLVQGAARATAGAPAARRSPIPYFSTEIGYGPLPKMNDRVFVDRCHSLMYHWNKRCPLMLRKPGIPQYRPRQRVYLTRWQAEMRRCYPCFHCSRVELDGQ